MYLSAPLNKRGENAPRRQRNVSGLFISTFDKYRQLSLEYVGDAPGWDGRRNGNGGGGGGAEDGRRNEGAPAGKVHAAGVAFSTEALEDESEGDEGFSSGERSKGRARPSYLRVPIYPEQVPFPLRARATADVSAVLMQ
jgi:hypothetical protein